MAFFDGLLNIIQPKKKSKVGGSTITTTYQPTNAAQKLAIPAYRDHLSDVFTTRTSSDSRALLKSLFRNDPDISSAVNGYLTMANTEMFAYAETVDGAIDPEVSKSLQAIIKRLTRQVDYTQGFQLKQSIYQLNENLRYMLMLRGGIGGELVVDKNGNPESIRNVDLSTIEWFEVKPGEYKPSQIVSGQQTNTSLDIPTFFVSFYRRDPTTIYTDSTFVAAINTIAARQQVINDLYRIMQKTGFPRINVTLLESVVIENAPASVKLDPEKLKTWVNERLAELQATFASIQTNQDLIHTDAIEVKILNDRNPGMAIDISSVMETLNAQNQAALKTMATILGRGSGGVNTGSVEARMAAMFADELNEPLAEFWEKLLSFCLHQQGFQGFAVVKFRLAELRPDLELEPQKQLRAARLRQDLSDGIISDTEYSLEMYGRLPNADAPPLSGTNFLTPKPTVSDVSPNSDPLGRSVSPDANPKAANANQKKSFGAPAVPKK